MPKGQPGTVAPHGTVSRYTHHNQPCRCADCRAAMRDYQRVKYGHRPREVVNAEREPQHGTESRYRNRGCRCGPCVYAASSARRERRHTGQVLTHNNSGYANGCRCDTCRLARNAYERERRRKRAAS